MRDGCKARHRSERLPVSTSRISRQVLQTARSAARNADRTEACALVVRMQSRRNRALRFVHACTRTGLCICEPISSLRSGSLADCVHTLAPAIILAYATFIHFCIACRSACRQPKGIANRIVDCASSGTTCAYCRGRRPLQLREAFPAYTVPVHLAGLFSSGPTTFCNSQDCVEVVPGRSPILY